jgi:hypothetical protein
MNSLPISRSSSSAGQQGLPAGQRDQLVRPPDSGHELWPWAFARDRVLSEGRSLCFSQESNEREGAGRHPHLYPPLAGLPSPPSSAVALLRRTGIQGGRGLLVMALNSPPSAKASIKNSPPLMGGEKGEGEVRLTQGWPIVRLLSLFSVPCSMPGVRKIRDR